ncbi:FAD/NAD(P)-binding domain-containing protein [Byssothecium circinans]|uniref:FAD/NAD(P)-binding domain-containing protein n=1 Tax=Byssothecium circinans TaxID=147558 RepID=A0A6A5TSU3_9PLEO|nr:FAD/NAD(P)-binding domain-containing protein [Byssothecium circinans]
MDPFAHVKTIAVIGAGPAGLAAVKYLKAENYFDNIVAFEQRDEVGGVWNYTGAVSESDQSDLTVPRTKPTDDVEQPLRKKTQNGKEKLGFPSPVYDSLETNIPHTLMQYGDKPFPEDCPLFPPFDIVKQYLEEYAADITSYLRLGRQVVAVESTKVNGKYATKWRVTYTDLGSRESHEELFDAVICASGHYSDPFIPDIQGISVFKERYPAIISHSKYYRNPEGYTQKKVIVIGNSASGIDISSQISTVTTQVIVSEKEKPTTLRNDSDSITYRPEIAEFLLPPNSRAVRFSDGHIESEIDSIIFCTGYQYSFPFLKGLDPPPITTGERTRNTYQQLFYYPQPTLAFLTLPQRIIPFPIAESQSAYIARVFAGRLTLPTTVEMKGWEDSVIEARGDGKSFHILAFPLDADYINMLHELSMSARVIESRELANRGQGKIPPFWNEEQRWTRQRFPMIKQAAMKLGEKRREVRSLRDLGFDFEEWKKEQEAEGECVKSNALLVEDVKSGVQKEISIPEVDDAA